ncbi:hypothetical protein G3G6_070 [Escherichia phage vB_EcoM-G3G6]|nr:hypothetical protein CHD2BS1_070 [Escherichia phage vB_EcoM-CHD2BS1]QZI80717.1 hypothetical protein CHD16UKE1_070 [Escherichia phage vB_EcoM-CHD16UKE1]QZI81457.1 hypothetical protein G3F6_070 [Escherichia phage vB_EcoM-G3F6]QZI82037.1 hypothetical protein G3F8_070 [Escherichia phage vB_EcoM-G3F8]QZI82327.1 hypothetical protein G3F9_070 [Escherichia phage vB_EcoM-G3F9]QZI82906.1 hypothetical protein G3G6_070 [Escherichia phage vB_EcoM-G3G6]QZI83196.1 hypothetical protein G3G7_070 [Escherich
MCHVSSFKLIFITNFINLFTFSACYGIIK